jgi:hypothetical protein
MAKKSSKGQGKTTGQGKARRKPAKVTDLPVGSRKARNVKGGAFSATGGTLKPIPGSSARYTI